MNPNPYISGEKEMKLASSRMDGTSSGFDLYWIPLGAGGAGFVRLNGRIYEAIKARRERRRPLDLYHAALEVHPPEAGFVIERTPIPDRRPDSRHRLQAEEERALLAGREPEEAVGILADDERREELYRAARRRQALERREGDRDEIAHAGDLHDRVRRAALGKAPAQVFVHALLL